MSKYEIETEKPSKEDLLPPRVRDFMNYISTIRGKSSSTIDAYTYDLTVFLKYMKIRKGLSDGNGEFEDTVISDLDDDFLRSVNLSDLYSYMGFLEKQRDNSSYARARKSASLRTFFRFLQGKARVIDQNPAAELESPRIKKSAPVYLSLDESVNLLKSMDKSDKDYYRDYCILTLFLNCGMRLSELISIRKKMIREDVITILGKGNKERTVYLNKACLKAIEEHLSHMDLTDVPEENRDFLFLSSHKKPISKRTVERLVKKHIGQSGLDSDKYTPHKLRHTAATLMYKHGDVDIRSLQMILGHENISTTQIYTHVDDERLRESVKANPLSDIDEWDDI